MDVTRSLVAATSSSRFIEPNYWRDPASGNAFQVQVELSPSKVKSGDDIASISLSKAGNTQPLAGDLIEAYEMEQVLRRLEPRAQ